MGRSVSLMRLGPLLPMVYTPSAAPPCHMLAPDSEMLVGRLEPASMPEAARRSAILPPQPERAAVSLPMDML